MLFLLLSMVKAGKNFGAICICIYYIAPVSICEAISLSLSTKCFMTLCGWRQGEAFSKWREAGHGGKMTF